MEKQIKKTIMMWGLGLICLIGMLLIFYGSEKYDEQYEEEVKCYDRFRNEIEGLICMKDKTDFSNITITGFLTFQI